MERIMIYFYTQVIHVSCFVRMGEYSIFRSNLMFFSLLRCALFVREYFK